MFSQPIFLLASAEACDRQTTVRVARRLDRVNHLPHCSQIEKEAAREGGKRLEWKNTNICVVVLYF